MSHEGNKDPFPDVTGHQPDLEMQFRPPRRGSSGEALSPADEPSPQISADVPDPKIR